MISLASDLYGYLLKSENGVATPEEEIPTSTFPYASDFKKYFIKWLE